MGRVKKYNLLIIFLFIGASFSCREIAVPKPRGHFRIDLPQKKYMIFNENQTKTGNMPLTFEYPVYGHLSFNVDNGNEPGWFNVEFPDYKAKIYLTYKKVNKNFEGLMEQTYKMNVKNHITKADAINEQVFSDSKNRIYGILYDLKGNTASAVQFYVTDSTDNYLRGSLYFSSEPNADSLAPVIDFFREDIIHMIETLRWKY